MFTPHFDLSEAFQNRLSNIDEANEFLRSLVFPRQTMTQIKDETLKTSISLIVHAEDSNVGYGRVARVLDAANSHSPLNSDMKRQITQTRSIIKEIRQSTKLKEMIHESTLNRWYLVLEQKSEVNDLIDSETNAYRISPKEILKSSDKIIYSAAPHDRLNDLVSDLIVWLKYESRGIHPILKGIIAYFQILIIRPFLKHNGKVGWFLFLAVLQDHGFDFGEYVSLEKGIFLEKKQFHNNVLRLITSTYDSNNYFSSNFQPYIMYLLPFIENTVAERRLFLERVHPKVVGEMLDQADINQRQREALAYVLQNERITNREYIQLNRIKSRKLAWEELNRLVAEEIFRKIGKGRNVFYSLSPIVTKETIRKQLQNN